MERDRWLFINVRVKHAKTRIEVSAPISDPLKLE